ncbi:LamG domain-containing protein [Streptomyces sp. NPDC005899]|uniref:LamG domain-containing protein n=1 Tax=Streptomyces sp. NPDC005899 TaxID=3155716 RepID=UPI0033E90CC5
MAITRGASDELSETQPGTATMTLDNADGALTPGNPNSPYHPYVRRNAPIRVSAAVMPTRSGPAPWPLSQMGDPFDGPAIDAALWTNRYGGSTIVNGRLRIPLSPGGSAGVQSARSWTLPGASVCARMTTAPKANGSSAALSHFILDGTTSGTRLGFQLNVVTQTLRCVNFVSFFDATPVDLPYSGIDHLWLRIRESSGTVYWETSPDGWDWTVRRSLATPGWAATQQLIMTLSTSRTGGTGDVAEWDLVGAQVYPRFYGMVNEWPITWEGLLSKVTISATDLFKRLNRLPELRSMLGMEVLTVDTTTGMYSFPAAYYPLSEPAESTTAGSVAGSGVGALAITQVGVGGLLEFGGEGVPETGEPAPTFSPVSASAGRYLVGDLGPQMVEDSTSWLAHIQVWIKTAAVSQAICGITDSNLDFQLVLALSSAGKLTVEAGNPLVVTTTTSANLADDVWHHIVYDGSAKRVYVDGVAVGGTLPTPTTQDTRTLYVGGYRGGRLWTGQIAHLSLHLATGPCGSVYAASYNAITGFSGESADTRVERLARYAGLPSVTVLGSTHDPVASQGPGGASVVSRLREVEATESGRLYAERDFYGLAYQSRDLRYNPSPLSEVFAIAYADLEPGIELADDDQKLVNEVQASRPGGATQTVTAPSSVLAFGSYPQQLTLLKMTDNSVTDAAYWLVSRYANPGPELREVPIEAYTMPTYQDILDADISSFFTVYDLPAQAPATELQATVEGYTETLRDVGHHITFRTSASSTDSVWILGDPLYSQLDYTTRLAY